MIKNKILSDSILIIFFSNSANLINMIIQVILSRTLSYSDFSLYYSLIALIGYLVIPSATIGMYLQKQFFSLINDNKDIYSFLLLSTKKLLFFFMCIFLIFLLFSDILKISFNHNNLYVFFNFYLVLILIIYMNWPISVNNALKNYKINSILYFTSSVLKLFFIILLFYFFNKGTLISAININLFFIFLLTFLYFLPFRNKLNKGYNSEYKSNFKILDSDFKFYAFHAFLIPFILSSDIILAKIFFSPEYASKYIVAASLSKIIYFITSGLYAVIFNESLGFSKKNTFLITIISFIISSLTMIFIIYFGKNIIELIYGDKFTGSHQYLAFLCGAVFMVSLSKIVCDILISRKKFGFIKYQFLTYCFFIYLTIYHFDDLIDLSRNIFLTSINLLVFIIFFFIKNYYNNVKILIFNKN